MKMINTIQQRKTRLKGFTLLEVILALGILAGIAGGVMQIFASGMDGAINTEAKSRAYVLAESKMDELLLEEFVADADLSGGFSGTEYRYFATVEAQEYPGEERDRTLLHIRLSVLWGQGNYEREVSLESLKLEIEDNG